MNTVPDAPVTRRPPVSRRLVVTAVLMPLLGVVGGLAWLWLAHPAQWEARESGIVLTEAAARGRFAVIVVFVAIGVIASFVWAWGATWALPDLGWLLIPLVLVLTAVAALIAWRVGVELGPPAPGSVAGVSIGDRLPDRLGVDGLAPFLVWPIFGLIGVIGATWMAPRGARDPRE
ncbi:MAG: hypothetical protein JWM93_740 [Frankiales bacterium]|nr:hypothetical protein [Frankiales bacterium]